MAEKAATTSKHEKLFEVFKTAITAEQEAQSFYRDAAALCEDEEMRGILLGFCSDEARHEQSLLKLYASYRQKYAEKG